MTTFIRAGQMEGWEIEASWGWGEKEMKTQCSLPDKELGRQRPERGLGKEETERQRQFTEKQSLKHVYHNLVELVKRKRLEEKRWFLSTKGSS